MLTIILPSAGKGTRLNLPYPKEIHGIAPGKSLIDLSLDHILANPDLVSTVVLVVTPGKEIVFDYVSLRLADVDCQVQQIYFNEDYSEWPGSILSAEHSFGARNVVLLPDSRLQPCDGKTLLAEYASHFDHGCDLTFAYLPETGPNRLTRLGALHLRDGLITDFCDKPVAEETSQFNAFWASFGFQKHCGQEVLNLMMRSVAREKVDLNALNLSVTGFAVSSYIDLGTWPTLSQYLQENSIG